MKQAIACLLSLCLLAALLCACTTTGALPPEAGQTTASDAPAKTAAPETDLSVPASTVPATEPAEAPATTEPPIEIPEDLHPMLFRVTGAGGEEMYLFGTIHAGDERNAAALSLVAPRLEECDALAVEFDILAFEADRNAAAEMMLPFLLLDGTTVEDHMPPETYQAASSLLDQAGLMPGMMKQFNLAMWAQLVEQAAMMTKSDLSTEYAMDSYLIRYAYDRSIEVRDVESAALQYGMLSSFPDELNLLIIQDTLDSLDTYGEDLDELYEAWCSGDYKAIQALNETEAEADEYTAEELALLEDYHRQMLDERNLGMRDRAVEWMQAGDKVFFAVGAGHLVGEAGLVTLLREAGYTVEQLSGSGAD